MYVFYCNFSYVLADKILASASKDLALASKLRPLAQIFGLGMALISLSYYVIWHFWGKKSCKIWEFF